jgi:hypothetical protein
MLATTAADLVVVAGLAASSGLGVFALAHRRVAISVLTALVPRDDPARRFAEPLTLAILVLWTVASGVMAIGCAIYLVIGS